ncbi:MAG: ATP-binding domain-containing protein, partial [Propionibacteriaceae bacterium]|nr:ATP-binding domain-containing protein [Propionibacteriaceae bacterium]
LDSHRLLCAHREGPYGAHRWNRVVSDWLALRPHQRGGLWQVGHPLLVTQNATLGASLDQVWNGDSGVIVATGQGPRAAIARAGQPLLVPPAMLDGVAELYAMTIHKSQGSQFDDVSVILPPLGSPLLTRELAYTALTRAKSSVTIYGSPDALAEAIRTPARRASGLARFSRGPRRSR